MFIVIFAFVCLLSIAAYCDEAVSEEGEATSVATEQGDDAEGEKPDRQYSQKQQKVSEKYPTSTFNKNSFLCFPSFYLLKECPICLYRLFSQDTLG